MFALFSIIRLHCFKTINKPFKRQSHKMVKHKQFVGNFPTNCLGVFAHFVGLALKWLRQGVESTLIFFSLWFISMYLLFHCIAMIRLFVDQIIILHFFMKKRVAFASIIWKMTPNLWKKSGFTSWGHAFLKIWWREGGWVNA